MTAMNPSLAGVDTVEEETDVEARATVVVDIVAGEAKVVTVEVKVATEPGATEDHSAVVAEAHPREVDAQAGSSSAVEEKRALERAVTTLIDRHPTTRSSVVMTD